MCGSFANIVGRLRLKNSDFAKEGMAVVLDKEGIRGNAWGQIMNSYTLGDKLSTLPDRYRVTIEYGVNYILQSMPEGGADAILLFGSCARGAVVIGSDVDLAVITKERFINREIRGDIHGELEINLKTGVASDVLFVTREQYRSSQERLFQHMREEGIVLWRREEGDELL